MPGSPVKLLQVTSPQAHERSWGLGAVGGFPEYRMLGLFPAKNPSLLPWTWGSRPSLLPQT